VAVLQPFAELYSTFSCYLSSAPSDVTLTRSNTLAGKLKQLGWNKEQLVVQTKLRFAGLGLSRAPAIEARTLGKMNLKVCGLGLVLLHSCYMTGHVFSSRSGSGPQQVACY
jgi:hypothetical protein